jgi:hypothetical protein
MVNELSVCNFSLVEVKLSELMDGDTILIETCNHIIQEQRILSVTSECKNTLKLSIRDLSTLEVSFLVGNKDSMYFKVIGLSLRKLITEKQIKLR